MKVLVVLGLVLAFCALSANAAGCLRQTPVSLFENCGPPRNALVLSRRSVVRCCGSANLYPLITLMDLRGFMQESCNCVPAEELCAQRPNRCNGGVPIQRFQDPIDRVTL